MNLTASGRMLTKTVSIVLITVIFILIIVLLTFSFLYPPRETYAKSMVPLSLKYRLGSDGVAKKNIDKLNDFEGDLKIATYDPKDFDSCFDAGRAIIKVDVATREVVLDRVKEVLGLEKSGYGHGGGP